MMDALASCVCVWSAARTGEAAGPSHDVSGCLALRLERQAVLQATGEARHRAPQRTVVPAHPSDESRERRVCVPPVCTHSHRSDPTRALRGERPARCGSSSESGCAVSWKRMALGNLL